MTPGTATYSGIANIGLGSGVSTTSAALGELAVSVNFTSNTLSGTVSNFQYLDTTPVAGSMTITNGVLTGNNGASIGSGLTADASGTVAGTALNFDVDGHFSGNSAEALFLYMDAKSSGDPTMGVAVGVKN